MNKAKISIRAIITIMILPLILCLALVTGLLAFMTKQTYNNAEELYYHKLYTINSNLVAADRDYYQAMFADTEIQILTLTGQTGGGDMDETKQMIVDDYEENAVQTLEKVQLAIETAKTDPMLYTGTTLEDGTTFEQLGQYFIDSYNQWYAAYSPSNGSGNFGDQNSIFFVAREYIDSMQEITENWAASRDAMLNSQINNQSLLLIIIFGAIIVALIILAILIENKIIKGFKDVSSSLSTMASGDFVNPISNKHFIKEFGQMSSNAEEMRVHLKNALLNVISLAGDVNSCATSAENSIVNSQRMTEDITHAVGDLAEGATSMAADVQNTSNLTINIGGSVDSVLTSTNENSTQGRQASENADNVKAQLEKLKEAGAVTDQMASQVAESVQETASFVEKISAAADSIIGIASQTNLLALNASIEAARAGESGKGFAVVADNIKNLAEESNEAAKEITDMLSHIVRLSETNQELTEKIKAATASEAVELQGMAESFDEMLSLLEKTEEGNKTIIELVNSLNSDKDSVMGSVESLSAISEENAASTEQTSASIEQLSSNMLEVAKEAQTLQEVSEKLQESIGFFRVK